MHDFVQRHFTWDMHDFVQRHFTWDMHDFVQRPNCRVSELTVYTTMHTDHDIVARNNAVIMKQLWSTALLCTKRSIKGKVT